DRDRLGAPASPIGDLAARALFFTIADAAKIRVPLAELAGRGLDRCGGGRVRVLDVGAGCGAMTLGLVAHLAARAEAPAATASIDPAGAAIVIEPALRATARDLEAVRDELLARGGVHVFAPCTRQVATCPMLDDPRDWCHEERSLELPPRAFRIAINTGLRDGA